MFTWLWRSPGLVRLVALILGSAAVAHTAPMWGQPVVWEVAVVYGITLGVAMRWPIVMPTTGLRVVLLGGLVMEALWRHGFATAVVLLLVEFAVRMASLANGRYRWEWYRPVLVIAALAGAYGLSVFVAGGQDGYLDLRAARSDEAAFVLVYAFWGLLNLTWVLLKAPQRGRSRLDEYLLSVRQTWWVPLVFLLDAWLMSLLHTTVYPVEIVACLGFLWIQSRVGNVFTTMHQDRAVARLVRTGMQSTAARTTAQQVLRMVYVLGRALSLPAAELRVIGYAAMLQDHLPQPDPPTPLWIGRPLGPEEAEAIRRHLAETVQSVERDGGLHEVASLISLRHAAYDGTGYPAIAGGQIPIGAQVLTAANAIVHLAAGAEQQRGLGRPRRAVDWIRQHAATHFSPAVLDAMSAACAEQGLADAVAGGLPGTVRQLQGLVAGHELPSDMLLGLRRIWLQMRGQTRFAPELPEEVQAVASMATYFASSTDATQTARIVVEAVGQLVGGKVLLAIAEGDGSDLNMRFRATYGYMSHLEGRTIAVMGGQMSRSILNQEPVQVADLLEMNSPIAHEIAREEGIRSVLFVPLVARGRTIGLLVVGTLSYHWFTPREVGLIHLMGGQAATALENARLIAEAEERLEHISNLKAFTDTLLDNLSTSIVVVEPEGRLVLSNAAARAWFGHVLRVGEPIREEMSASWQLCRALAGESVAEVDLPWGANILEVQSVPLRDRNGVMVGAICLARDVTRVRAMEQQVRRVEKLAAIGELAAGAAHEIRNPLTAIRGFIQLLQGRVSATDGEFVQIILNEIDRIDEIIRDLLLLARPAELHRVETALPALIDEVLLLNQTELKRQGVQVVRQFDPAVGPFSLDPKMFRQLLFNLMKNALQAMPEGGTLRLALRRISQDQVALSVTDTGVGITPENLSRLFVPFFTTKEQGTGLGLALCYSIVQAHQGRIDVQSRVGEGTTFTITLPAR